LHFTRRVCDDPQNIATPGAEPGAIKIKGTHRPDVLRIFHVVPRRMASKRIEPSYSLATALFNVGPTLQSRNRHRFHAPKSVGWSEYASRAGMRMFTKHGPGGFDRMPEMGGSADASQSLRHPDTRLLSTSILTKWLCK
jgi:hypothetical protein